MFGKAFICAVLLGIVTAADWKPEEYVAKLAADAPTLNFFGNPDDCMVYYLAYKTDGKWQIYNFKCAADLKWSTEANTCVLGKCDDVVCTVDGALMANPDNCATFYHCSHGKAHKKCCPAGLAWNATEEICDYVASCKQTPDCPVEEQVEPVSTTLGPEPEFCVIGDYIYEKVDGKPNLYKLTNNATGTPTVESMGTPCPVDHVFSTRECGCLNTKPVIPVGDGKERCVLLDFDKEIGSSKVYVGKDGKGIERKDGKVCFTGEGKLTIPYYNDVPLGRNITVSFSYSSTSQDAIFVANAMNVATSSFAIYLEKGNVKAKVVTPDGVHVAEEKAVEGTISVNYRGKDKELSLTVDKTTVKVTASGNILKKRSDMIVGSSFVGCIDDFDFCPVSENN